jgi:hypothetical protein
VAILLDNFVSSASQIKREEEQSLSNEYRRVEEGLNPLLRLVLHLAQVCFTREVDGAGGRGRGGGGQRDSDSVRVGGSE